MSEQVWRRFPGAGGADDWVVPHGGAAAVFRTGSLVAAARPAGAITDVAGADSGIELVATWPDGSGIRGLAIGAVE